MSGQQDKAEVPAPPLRKAGRRGLIMAIIGVALVAAAVVFPLLEGPDVVGTYVLDAPDSTVVLTLEEDGIARVQAPGSEELTGSWALQENQIIIEVPEDNEQLFQLREDTLIDPNGQRWVKTDEEDLPDATPVPTQTP